MNVLSKAISIIAAIAIMLSIIPTDITVFADSAKIQIVNAEGLATKNDIVVGDGYTLHANNYWCMIHTSDSMRAVYCLEPGKGIDSGEKYDEDATDNYLDDVKNKMLDSKDIRSLLGRVFLYAYTGKLDSVEAYNRYAATQLLVWEVIVGQRDENFNLISNGYTSVEKMLTNFQSDYAAQVVSSYYYEYEKLIMEHSKSVSFGKSTEASAARNLFNVGSDGSYTFTDNHSVLSNFDASVKNGSVVSKSGNMLKIEANGGEIAVVTLTQNNVKESGELTGFVTLTCDSKQTLAELQADPRKYYVEVKGLENGTLNIVKTSEDGIIANIEFTVTGNGETYNVKTDKNGEISIPNLKAGSYTVTEKVPVRYDSQQSKTVTVQAGKTASVSFANTLKKGSIKINKQAEDGEIGGRIFVITGNGKNYTINTNDSGIATLSDIPVYDSNDKKITYIISEKNVPVKYVIPADQTATLIVDATTTKTFKNVLKKFTATITKKDAEFGTAQGDGTLSGAVYGLYKDGKLVDTYTTDEKGTFTTKEYVCGDYTIKEISPSDGYLLDETVYQVGAEAKNYIVENNAINMTVNEKIVKGKIAIIKHNDDGSTKIETPEVGAEFQIYLKSAGSFSDVKDTEKDVLVCNYDGFAQSKDLPYGVYVVHQTKGNEGIEFMSDFTVNICESGKTYRYLINNATFTALVKIVKKDAETGKIIPVSGIGFKVKGKSTGEYISQSFNYPQPTTLDTFYTDESGSLMLPEELPYGEYELEEVATANGYWLGNEKVSFKVDGTEQVITVEKFNTAQKGRISIHKTGNVFSSVAIASSANVDENGKEVINPTTYSPVFEEKTLSNAVFDVIAQSVPKRVILLQKSQPIKTVMLRLICFILASMK